MELTKQYINIPCGAKLFKFSHVRFMGLLFVFYLSVLFKSLILFLFAFR